MHNISERYSSTVVVYGNNTPRSGHDGCPNVYINCLSNPIYRYISIAVSFFEATLYKLYTSVITLLKYKFLQQAGIMDGQLLKLIA